MTVNRRFDPVPHSGIAARESVSDAIVSVGVVASALAVALGAPVADPLIGLAITLMILKITWDSLRTVRAG